MINSNFRELLHPRIRRQLAEDRISATDLKRHYYGDADVTIQNVKIYAEMTTDLYFKNDILHIWQLQSRSRSPTFCYKFTYDKDISFLKSVFNIQHLPGTILNFIVIILQVQATICYCIVYFQVPVILTN